MIPNPRSIRIGKAEFLEQLPNPGEQRRTQSVALRCQICKAMAAGPITVVFKADGKTLLEIDDEAWFHDDKSREDHNPRVSLTLTD